MTADPTASWRRRSARACLLLLVLLCVPRLGQAQGDPVGYLPIIEEAISEFDARNFLEARALFLRAHKLQPSARTLRGLGAVSFELRSYVESVSYLDAALASRDKPLTGALRAEAARLRDRARGFVAELRLALQPSDVSVLVDGHPVEPRSGALWLDIGEHRLEFRAPGHAPEVRGFHVRGGDGEVWTIALAPIVAPLAAAGGQAAAPTAAGPRSERLGSASSSAATPTLTRRAVRNRVIAGSLLGAAGAVGLGTAAFRFSTHVDDGRAVRTRGQGDLSVQDAWNDSRALPLVLAGAGSGLLAAGAAVVSDLVPPPHRRWLSPLLLAAGTSVLVAGLVGVARGGACDADRPGGLRTCVLASEQRDRGVFIAVSALPLLTVPARHALTWLRAR